MRGGKPQKRIEKQMDVGWAETSVLPNKHTSLQPGGGPHSSHPSMVRGAAVCWGGLHDREVQVNQIWAKSQEELLRERV